MESKEGMLVVALGIPSSDEFSPFEENQLGIVMNFDLDTKVAGVLTESGFYNVSESNLISLAEVPATHQDSVMDALMYCLPQVIARLARLSAVHLRAVCSEENAIGR